MFSQRLMRNCAVYHRFLQPIVPGYVKSFSALVKGSVNKTCKAFSAGKFYQKDSSIAAKTEAALPEVSDELRLIEKSKQSVAGRINLHLQKRTHGRLFAVVHMCGVQRKVTTEDIVVWHGNLAADIGERIRLEKVLLVGSKDFTIVGRPVLSRDLVRVEATVIEKFLEHVKVRAFYKRRRRTRKMIPYQQPLAYLRINSVQLNTIPEENDSALDSS